MPPNIEVVPDPAHPAGHALIRVRGAARAVSDPRFRLHRPDEQASVLGTEGWQVAESLLSPDSAVADGDDLVLSVGPAVANHLESRGYQLGIPAAGIVSPAFWPEIASLHSGSYRNIATGARRGSMTGGARGLGPVPVPVPVTAPPADPPAPAVPPLPVPPPLVPPKSETTPAPPLVVPLPVKPAASRLLPILLILLLIAGGAVWAGWYYWPWPFWPVAVPPPPDQTQHDTTPPPTPPSPISLDDLLVTEVIKRASGPAEILEQAQRRMLAGKADDALLLTEAAANRHFAPAMVALARLYDPLLPRHGHIRDNARQAARYYQDAAKAGDTSSADARAALKADLQRRDANGDMNASLILKDFWP